jgi:hypothetical protein
VTEVPREHDHASHTEAPRLPAVPRGVLIDGEFDAADGATMTTYDPVVIALWAHARGHTAPPPTTVAAVCPARRDAVAGPAPGLDAESPGAT